jgi:cob(I)alamin adenosyltransferase
MEEKIHNVNLQPIESVRKWDTKRVKAYMERIQKHISYIESGLHTDEHGNSEKIDEIVLQKFKNYKEELKKILKNREHIQ